jgi:hypothetical protein
MKTPLDVVRRLGQSYGNHHYTIGVMIKRAFASFFKGRQTNTTQRLKGDLHSAQALFYFTFTL